MLTYMRTFEDTAIELGIPVKTRHNEVAPAQLLPLIIIFY
ncbi:hypothetical protein PRO82_001914 [Candidatus Protochlamydia amoebophila]|nr:hypothetical protein [Candidatus Protochlamydia amoebophila]